MQRDYQDCPHKKNDNISHFRAQNFICQNVKTQSRPVGVVFTFVCRERKLERV